MYGKTEIRIASALHLLSVLHDLIPHENVQDFTAIPRLTNAKFWFKCSLNVHAESCILIGRTNIHYCCLIIGDFFSGQGGEHASKYT